MYIYSTSDGVHVLVNCSGHSASNWHRWYPRTSTNTVSLPTPTPQTCVSMAVALTVKPTGVRLSVERLLSIVWNSPKTVQLMYRRITHCTLYLYSEWRWGCPTHRLVFRAPPCSPAAPAGLGGLRAAYWKQWQASIDSRPQQKS